MRNKIAAARFRAETFSRIRDFFAGRNVLEVETPLLSQGASHDFHIDLFTVPSASGQTPRFLQTSPEPHMKRMLARGYPDIFQISKAFRVEEKGCRHNPEFTLVEWYRLGFPLLKMMEETVELCRLVIGPRPAVHTSYTEAFSSATGLNPISAKREQLTSHPAVAAHGLTSGHFPEIADVLDFLMSEVVEPTFNAEVLTVIHGFPSVLPSQAMSDPEHPGTSLRFEVFGGGMELGNGYQELLNPREYRMRFKEENLKRMKAGKSVPPLDERWLSDIKDGLPPCSGVALGLDRLICMALGVNNIEAILEFPWEDS